MTRYLVAIHHPDDYNPAVAEDEAMHRDIDVLNDEMVAASVRVLVGGLEPVGRAKSVRNQPKGEVLVTDGPYIETKEHIGGFWVLELATLDEALAWARKAATAYRAPVEVRFMERFNSAFVAHRPQDLDDLIGEGCVLENTARATKGVRHASVSGRKWRPRRATCSKRRRFGPAGTAGSSAGRSAGASAKAIASGRQYHARAGRKDRRRHGIREGIGKCLILSTSPALRGLRPMLRDWSSPLAGELT